MDSGRERGSSIEGEEDWDSMSVSTPRDQASEGNTDCEGFSSVDSGDSSYSVDVSDQGRRVVQRRRGSGGSCSGSA